MKKHYISLAALAIMAGLSLTCMTHAVQAQSMPEFTPFTPTNLYTWDGNNFQSYEYSKPGLGGGINPMRFRLMAPNGFDRNAPDGQKYPIIVFLHGAGEAGSPDPALQDNEEHLFHGGQTHMNAVLNNTFPGFLLYPQIRDVAGPTGPSWGTSSLELITYILDKLIEGYKVDPDRIYIHGLSLGGDGTWRAINLFPQYFAAAHPMSSAGQIFWSEGRMDTYIHLPIRHAQGGKDTAPTKEQGNDQVTAIRGIGGNIRYSYYPNGGHAIWNNEYTKGDFFSWFLSKKKNMIHVFYEQTSFCPENPISVTNPVKLGLTPGFANYEWAMTTTSNIVHSGATANEYLATSAGTYYARFQRSSGVWTDWSPAVVLNNNRAASPTPGISTNGKSVNLPPLDGSADVTLYGTAGKSFYQWRRNASNYSTTPNITVNTAGTYTLASKEPGGALLDVNGAPTEFRPALEGCLSAYSSPVTVTTQNGPGSPAPPANFFAAPASNTSISIRWDDRATNETGFELYRSTTPGSSYTLIAILPTSATANPKSYTDINLQTNTTYYYRMRAVNTAGGSAYTPEISATTTQDNIAPTSPVLLVASTSHTEINLFWHSAVDNVGVTEYDIYQNGALIATTSATTYKAIGVVSMNTYTFMVKARDLANNVSPPSNQVNAAAINAGLFFRYYHHNNLTSTTQIETLGTFRFSGMVSTFSLETNPPHTQINKIAYIYEGFIYIPTTGSYTFYTQSDDGSQLFIDNTLNVNNDGQHACIKMAGTPLNLSAGTYPIKLTYFENGASECLTVSWKGPGFDEQPIPASALSDDYTPPAPLSAPTNFTVNTPAPTYNQINLNWTDNSSDETGFEISRTKGSANVNGTYQVVFVTAADATSWTDTGLDPASQYNYKIRAISATSASALIGPMSIATAAAPPAPPVPTGLNTTPIASTQVDLAWTDVSGETGYEIQKSSSTASSGFLTIAIKEPNSTTHTDLQVTGHATLYYRIRALGNGGANSAYSSAVSVITPNQAPVIADIPDQLITQGTATPQIINATVTDEDLDPITFTVTGLPAGGTASDDGYGKLTLTFVNVASGSYPVTVQASDGIATTSDNFTLAVTGNHNPVIQDVAINGGTATPTTIIPNQTTEGGRPLTLAIRVTDPDGNAELLTTLPPLFSNLPPFVTTNTWTGTSTNPRTLTLRFSPEATVAGVYNDITVTFRDNQGGTNTQIFSLVVSPLDKSYTIKVNFNYNGANNEVSPWNNMGAPLTTDRINLLDDQGSPVKYVALNTGGTSVWNTTTPPSGTLPADPAGVYTDKVRQSFYRRSNGTAATIQFKNLNPELRYKVILYGAYPGTAGAVLNTRYTVTGTTAETLPDLNVINNTSVTRISSLLQANNGLITITVARGTGNAGFFYINALELKAILPSNDPPDAPSNLTLTAPAYNTVNLAWQDNSINETSFEILRAMDAAGPYTVVGSALEDQTTFTDTNGLDGRTTYYYKVNAVNTFGANETDFSSITTPNGAPIISNPGTIIVKAGETLQKNISATDPEGDPIIFSTTDLPSFATLTDNGDGTGFIDFAPQPGDAGTHTFTLEATDDQSATAQLVANLLVVDSEYDEAFFLNFISSAAANAEAPWNNMLPFANVAALKNTLNVTSSNLSFTAGTGWTGSSNTAGVSTGNNSGRYPDKVIQSSWSTNNTAAGVTMSLSNLDDSKLYNIALFGSTNDFWFGNTLFTINGVTKTLNTIQNKSNIVRFTGIQPVSNTISIVVKKAPNVPTGGTKPTLAQRDARLGAMIVEAYTIGSIPRRPTNLVAKGISRTAIRLTWFDNSPDETGFEIYRSDFPGGPFALLTTVAANTETFDNTALPQNTAYTYRIRAIKTPAQSIFSNDAVATTFNQVILVNFTSSGPTDLQAPTPPWNNTNNPSPVTGVNFNNLKDDTGVNTVVDLSILESAGYTNNTGFLPGAGDPPGIYPNSVSQGFYYWNSNTPGRWRIKQLNPSYVYDLVFYANEWNAIAIDGVNCTTDWTVGSRTVSLFNNKNAYETVSLEQLTPEADGTILISAVNNPVAAAGVWNSLEIRSYTPLTSGSGLRTASVDEGKSLNPSLEQESSGNVTLYPNPVKDVIKIALPAATGTDKRVTISIYNTLGILISKYDKINAAQQIELPAADLTSGYYAVVIEMNGRMVQKRFIKE